MKKPLNFIISYGIYPFDVMVSIAEPDEELFKILQGYGCEDEFDLVKWSETNEARCVMFKNNATLIRLKHYPATPAAKGHLAHEVFHAVEFLMERIGVKHNVDCGEAYAYCIQYLTTEIYKKIKP